MLTGEPASARCRENTRKERNSEKRWGWHVKGAGNTEGLRAKAGEAGLLLGPPSGPPAQPPLGSSWTPLPAGSRLCLFSVFNVS